MVSKIFKKSQAALEFLTTYGWAFLVILIMISTLAYFGILSPSRILPNRCNIGSEFQCLDSQITSTTFKMRLKNNVGEPIDVSAINFQSESVTPFSCTNPVPPAPPAGLNVWKSGDVKDLLWTGCSGGGVVQGEKIKVGLTVTYNTVTSGATYSKPVNGEVYTSVS